MRKIVSPQAKRVAEQMQSEYPAAFHRMLPIIKKQSSDDASATILATFNALAAELLHMTALAECVGILAPTEHGRKSVAELMGCMAVFAGDSGFKGFDSILVKWDAENAAYIAAHN